MATKNNDGIHSSGVTPMRYFASALLLLIFSTSAGRSERLNIICPFQKQQFSEPLSNGLVGFILGAVVCNLGANSGDLTWASGSLQSELSRLVTGTVDDPNGGITLKVTDGGFFKNSDSKTAGLPGSGRFSRSRLAEGANRVKYRNSRDKNPRLHPLPAPFPSVPAGFDSWSRALAGADHGAHGGGDRGKSAVRKLRVVNSISS